MARVENSIKNISFSLVSQLITTVLSFVLRTVLIETVGIESVALKSLFFEIVSVLALSELGIGSAIAFNMFKPLKDGDEVKVRELMNFYKKAYRIIAGAVFGIGVIICCFVQFFVKDVSFDTWYLRLTFMLFVSQSALSYLFSYKATLLNCDQKNYIVTRITTAVKAIGTILIIVLLYLTKNFIVYIIGEIVLTFSTNVAISIKTDHMYPFLKGNEKLPKSEQKKVFGNIKNIFFKSMAGKIVGSTDNMLISVIVSTITVGFYANYTTVIMVFRSIMDSCAQGIDASVGNMYVSEEPDKCNRVVNRLTYAFFVASAIFVVGIFVCIQPFISLWIGVEYLLSETTVFIICVVLLLYVMSKPISTAMHYTGMFDIGRNISIISAVINLAVSIVLGLIIGIDGIFIGTICVYVFEIIAKSYFLYRRHFKLNPYNYLLKMLLYVAGIIALMIMCRIGVALIPLSGYLTTFLIRGVVCVVATVAIIVGTTFYTDDFKYYIRLAVGFLKKKKG